MLFLKNSQDYFYDVNMHYLASGDQIDLATFKVTPSTAKHSLAGKERYKYPKSPSYDIFSSPDNSGTSGRRNPREFIHISQDLFDSYAADSTTA